MRECLEPINTVIWSPTTIPDSTEWEWSSWMSAQIVKTKTAYQWVRKRNRSK